MCNETRRCGAWISLENNGIQAEGCMRNPEWLRTIVIPNSHSIFNDALYIDLPSEKLTCVKNVARGNFGYIDLARYETKNKSKEVFVKRPIVPGKSLLYEACIQKLVRQSLSEIGFPTGAAKVINIFRLKDDSVCFSMEQIKNSTTLDRYLDKLSPNILLNVVIDCLLQLCGMIWHLDCALGINHRDLKPSNFLLIEHDEPIRKVINIEDEILEINSNYSLTFIDFGFSCLGSTETHNSTISLSTVYSKKDPCPKEGRDIYLFLAFLYIDFHTKLPSKLSVLFEKWLNVNGTNVCSFLRKDKEYSKKWLYFMAGNEKILKFEVCPYKIVKDLEAFMNS
jgi:serine/threonine protein kinase